MRRTRFGLSRDRPPRMKPSQPAPFSSPSPVLVLFSRSISISLAVVGSIGGVFSALRVLFDGTIELGAAAAAVPAVTPPTPLKAAAGWPNCLLLFSAARARRELGLGLWASGPALGAQPGEGREGDYEFGGERALHNHGHRRVRARDEHE